MTIRYLMICLAAATFWGTPVKAQTLWQNVTYGMTVQEVLAKQPDATANAKPDHLHDGATCDLVLRQYKAATDNYRVCFFFLNKALTQVTMGFDGRPTKLDFDEAVLNLTAKYGQPLNQSRTTLGWGADWKIEGDVNVTVFFLSELSPLMNIVYQKRLAADASRF